ncbi:MAG: asparagine synthase-related protein [Candidatus Acidiferrum sp.]
MSGICGICRPGAEISKASLEPMLSSLVVSDEAAAGILSGRSVGLGVLPRFPGQQVAEVAHVRVALDSDFVDLQSARKRLSAESLSPSEMSLADQVAWLYVLRGAAFVEDLRGAFAIAIWDDKNQRLLLVSDRMGLKTMYWAQEGGQLSFASRAGAVRAVQAGHAAVNTDAVLQYLLFSVVPAPLSAYKGIERLAPGRLLIFEKGQSKQSQYWDATYEEDKGHNEAYWAERVREGIRAAVHSHLDGCTSESTGAFLSGGTDSSSVVAFLSEKFTPANSFSIAFEEGRYNEIDFARTSAQKFHTCHHEQFLTATDAADAISLIARYYDEPFANSSAIGSYFCAKMARENGVTTLLAGDGGDELFGGNERYASDKRFALYHNIPAWLRKSLIEPAAKLLPDGDGKLSLPRKYIRRASIPNPRRIFSYGLFLTLDPKEVFEPDFLQQVPPEHWLDLIEDHFDNANATTELNRLLYLDLKLILSDNDVRKVSGTAELSGVQVRYPLMDHDLVALTGHLPTRLKVKGFEKRYIFKQAMREILPNKVLYKKKHGFGVPLAVWLLQNPRLQSLIQDTLGDSRTRQRGYFRPAFYDRLAKLHREGNLAYYGEIVWYLVALELWHRQHLEKEASFVRT